MFDFAALFFFFLASKKTLMGLVSVAGGGDDQPLHRGCRKEKCLCHHHHGGFFWCQPSRVRQVKCDNSRNQAPIYSCVREYRLTLLVQASRYVHSYVSRGEQYSCMK